MKNGKNKSSFSEEVAVNFGYLYRTIEERIDAFAAQSGNPHSLADIADRMGELLRLKAENVRAVSGASEFLQQVREVGETTGQGTKARRGRKTRKKVSGVTPAGRTLKRKRHRISVTARKRISRAQKKRWKEWHARQRETEI